jgi:predicted NBD/HSP70 family sugar kinase
MESKRATVRDLRRQNRSVLLCTLFFDGPLSRHELGQVTGLSAATVSNLVGELVDERLVIEAGMVESEGGRPRVLLRVNPEYGHVIGIDVGETGVVVELFDMAMNALATTERTLASRRPTPRAVVGHITSALRDVLAEADVDESSVIGVGVGVPGTVADGTVHAQTIGWAATPLRKMLQDAGVGMPLYFDNGAKTQGQAEMWFGAGRGARHAVIALIGSGVGSAVIADGIAYRGSTSSAGEWGHTTIVYGGRMCRCGARGCLEAYVGGEGVLSRYKQARGGRAVPGTDEQAQLAGLVAAAGKSKVAAQVLDETAQYLGAGIGSLINMFNPERVVIGGWAGLVLGPRLLPQITDAARETALRHPFQGTSIQLCELGPDAVAVGAATLPVAALLTSGGQRRHVNGKNTDAA